MSDTRTSILDAAEYAVRERGLDGFSYADLSEKVGIRKASIHHHFAAKDDLALAIMHRYAERHFTALADISSQTLTAGKSLAHFIARYRGGYEDNFLLCLCVAFSLSPKSLSQDLLLKIADFQAKNIAWLVEKFEQARFDGSVLNVRDAKTEAFACLALLEGAQILARTANESSYFELAMNPLESRFSNRSHQAF